MNAFARIVIALCAGFAAQISTNARAEISENWTFCDSCTTKRQFESAALAWLGNNTGTYVVEVGNTASSTVYQVSVTGSNVPITPNDAQRVNEGAGAPVVNLVYTEYATGADETTASPGAHYAVVNYSIPEASQTNTQFGKIVAMVKMEPILVPPPNPGTPGYDSFYGRDMAIVSRDLWQTMSIHYPGWQQGQIAGNPLKALQNALNMLRGKGPTACQVFVNGDVACFQLNLADENAARYVTGTAKDAEGRPLPESGGLGGGSGINVNHISNNPYVTGYQFPSGSWWLMCTYVGGVKVSCRVEWVAE